MILSSASGASNASTSKPPKESGTPGNASKSEKDFDLYDFRVESDEEQSADNR